MNSAFIWVLSVLFTSPFLEGIKVGSNLPELPFVNMRFKPILIFLREVFREIPMEIPSVFLRYSSFEKPITAPIIPLIVGGGGNGKLRGEEVV